jgi:hypothetical protein
MWGTMNQWNQKQFHGASGSFYESPQMGGIVGGLDFFLGPYQCLVHPFARDHTEVTT